jgi:hypothetical protein
MARSPQIVVNKLVKTGEFLSGIASAFIYKTERQKVSNEGYNSLKSSILFTLLCLLPRKSGIDVRYLELFNSNNF